MVYSPNYYGVASAGNAATSDPRSIYVDVGATPTKSIECGVDVSGMILEIAIEPIGSTTDVTIVADASITKSTVFASFIVPTAVTTTERTLKATVRNVANDEVIGSANIYVTYAAIGDA